MTGKSAAAADCINKGYSEFEWEIRNSRDGHKVLLLGGRLIYSLYRPLEQVERLSRSLIGTAEKEGCDHIIIIGMGLGYLPRSLYKAGFEKIIVWEPFPVMQESLHVCDGEWRNAVIVVTGSGEFEKAAVHFANKGARPKLIIHPGYDIFCRLEYRLALQVLGKIYNDNEGCHKSYIVSSRSLESLVRLPFLGTVKEFDGAFEGRKAVLVNPGPSLKQYAHVLKGAKDAIIFASLQAASYLQKNGIRVNFIVCADPKDYSPYIAECNNDFDVFLAETCVDPASLDWAKEKTFLFHFRCGQVHEMLWEEARLPVIDDPVSTVSEVMLLLADHMGFNEIYCIGMDYCWQEERYTYRTGHMVDNEHRVKDAMTNFQLSTGDNRTATTRSDYFHGARFMRHKSSELRKRGKSVYQTAGGVDFTSACMLTVNELMEKLHCGKVGETFKVVKQKAPADVERVVRLLNEIKSGKIKSRRTSRNENKMWPFFLEIPAEKLAGICDVLSGRLRSAAGTGNRQVLNAGDLY